MNLLNPNQRFQQVSLWITTALIAVALGVFMVLTLTLLTHGYLAFILWVGDLVGLASPIPTNHPSE